ncbi:MAG: secretin N-terminal domain-containing protein [bacterium]|nr:secretin N-terminal domain-containing protein [bacterium]
MNRKTVSSLVIAGLLLAGSLFPQSTLESIKKGNRGDKSWAVFAFDKKAVWIGLSQDDAGQITLYFLGEAGSMDGSVVTIDPEYDRSILVRQVTADPPVFRADIGYEPNLPLSILKKNGHVVVAFNDERLLDGTQIAYGDAVSQTARLISVSPTSSQDRMTLSMQFDGRFDWTGFARHADRTAALFIGNSELAVPAGETPIPSGAFQRLQLSPVLGQSPGIRALLGVLPDSRFNVVLKGNALLLDSPRRPEGGDLFASVPERASAETQIQPVVQPDRARSDISVPLPNVPESPVPDDGSRAIPWDQRVSFEFNGTPVRDALRLVAASNQLNMVVSEAVKGKTTMKLENVTLRQAMDKIIHTNDCDYFIDGNIITVRPMALTSKAGRITKIYRLRYADAVNVAKVVKRIATNDSLVEAFASDFLDYEQAGKARTDYELSTVQGIRRSSILVVTDSPEKVGQINQVIAELDRAPVQILIESKLVEVAPSFKNELGIDWDKTLNMAYSTNRLNDQKSTVISNGAGETPMFGLSRTMTLGRLNASQYVAMLDFLKTKTNSKLVSNPRLLATDNEESSISVGKTVPVARVQRGMGGQGDMVTFDYKEISIRLNVTPHVGPNDEITMYVNPIIEEIVDWKVIAGNEAPVTDKRSVNSIITVRNGETVVIGGLVKTLRNETTKRLWLLGSLPLIGRLFQHDYEQDMQTDLMIFITPTITPVSDAQA